MAKDDRNQAYHRLLNEVNQAHAVRRSLYADLETELGQNKRVVALCTSFRWPVLIEDRDADMLEEALRNSDMHGRELVLIVNSAGGLALPAERIVNICRTYSKGGKYAVIVPKMAKLAATMVCLGADRIGMSRTSELGPIDPQISITDESGGRYLAAHEIVESYEELMRKANRTSGRIEPYLQQLQRFDARDVRAVRSARELSENIAVR
jgi:ClpP class serine protease